MTVEIPAESHAIEELVSGLRETCCPHCGCESLFIRGLPVGNRVVLVRVECGDCLAASSALSSAEEAVESWRQVYFKRGIERIPALQTEETE